MFLATFCQSKLYFVYFQTKYLLRNNLNPKMVTSYKYFIPSKLPNCSSIYWNPQRYYLIPGQASTFGCLYCVKTKQYWCKTVQMLVFTSAIFMFVLSRMRYELTMGSWVKLVSNTASVVLLNGLAFIHFRCSVRFSPHDSTNTHHNIDNLASIVKNLGLTLEYIAKTSSLIGCCLGVGN